MRAWRHLGCALAAVVLGAAQLGGCSGDDSGDDSCTLIGCGPNVKVWLPYSENLLTLQGATAKFCRNDEVCFEGPAILVVHDGTPSVSFALQSTASGDEAARAGNVHSYSVSAEPVELYFEYYAGDVEALADGDRYTIDIAGATPVSFIGNVSAYRVSQPNGPKCGPTCKAFEFDTR